MHAVTVFALPWLLALAGSTDDELLARAQDRFHLGVAKLRNVAESRRLFARAAADFAQLHERGVRSPALYLSLGNAEALAGRWPRAIWAYQCGLRLDPNDAALRTHLEYARSLVNYPRGDRPAADAWPGWLYQPSTAQLLLVAAVAYSLAWLAGGWWYRRRRTGLLAVTLGGVAIALAAGAGYLVADRWAAFDRESPIVVVIADGTTLHRGNGPTYPLNPDVPSLPAGAEARRLTQRGAWLMVQLAGGETGWVPAAKVLVVE
jgi:hypothetical protein